MRPRLLMLDEPVAGLNFQEKLEFVKIIDSVRASWISPSAVEHDMQTVMRIADRVVALDFGQAIAFGTPEDVSAIRKCSAPTSATWSPLPTRGGGGSWPRVDSAIMEAPVTTSAFTPWVARVRSMTRPAPSRSTRTVRCGHSRRTRSSGWRGLSRSRFPPRAWRRAIASPPVGGRRSVDRVGHRYPGARRGLGVPGSAVGGPGRWSAEPRLRALVVDRPATAHRLLASLGASPAPTLALVGQPSLFDAVAGTDSSGGNPSRSAATNPPIAGSRRPGWWRSSRLTSRRSCGTRSR